MSVKLRLIVMNFLQFAVWGAYLTSMGTYLNNVGLGADIGLFYAMQGVVSIFMPIILGIIADRWIQAQKLLGISHAFAAIFIFAAGSYAMTAGSNVQFPVLFTFYSLSVAFYMPTIALSNSVAYNVLVRYNYDTIKAFPPIRTFGTIGFICAMLFVDFTGFQNNHTQFFVSAILELTLFFYAFTLPNCPVNSGNKKQTLYNALGLKAFSLFKNKRMATFFVFSMLLGVSLQITNGYANPYITSYKYLPEYSTTWGANHANALISLSQVSETLCILLIPFFMKRFGIKKVILMSMVAWFLRFILLGIGNPGSGIWMFIASMIVYGIAFDFYNVSGSLFVEKETNKSLRSSAQGVFMMMTNGFGATLGMLAAGVIVNHFVYSKISPVAKMEGWKISWNIFSAYALIVTLLFAVIFKYKHLSENT